MEVNSIDEQIKDTKKELEAMLAYPDEKLIDIIKEVGFECDLCARCCTKEFNDHVFLLDKDTEFIKSIDLGLIKPAPYYEFCDQNGRFYVSGYALRTKEDGSCVMLEGKRCTMYDRRLTICRLYPYMLHRETDEEGNLDWRQISGLNEHGCYHSEISEDEAEKIAADTKAYEEAYLRQQIRFFRKVRDHFKKNGLRHVKSTYDRKMRAFGRGEEIEVYVYYKDELELSRISVDD
ncbi:hypothetical protein SAMN04488587_0157 [Methanococcoides vulcani]|uniref:Fe-S-cluster containining protein n=1 Tax=Methanococcoides vulcani TaxID=1353158 RepID=A0A1H9Y2C7_9EURY|nr:YkgJ family cysteine cluster protein [Methanococcoides vulcani]SES62808.1 hypothetical protein SAMN04488587_0157 [Methanococcoides vulcani]